MKKSRHFMRCMGQWLMTLLLVMLTSLATRAAEAYACYTPGNTTLTFYYDGQRASRTGTTYDLNTGEDYTDWENDGTNASVTKVVFDPSFADARPTTTNSWFYDMANLESITGMSYLNTSEVTNMGWMFTGCNQLTSIDVSGFNTSNVTNMYGMFYNCYALTSLDVSGFNTSNVTNMSYMFYYCSALTSLDVSGFNTSKVTDMSSMFYNCQALTSLDVSGFNTSKVTSMNSMFYNCTALTSLDVSGFNTSNVTDMYNMFRICQGLTSLDLSSFNTSNVTTLRAMFYGCSGLTSLDVSSFSTSKVTDMYALFADCRNLTTIYAGSEWSTEAVTSSSDMFYGCASLVGGQGTTYNASNPRDKTYAHIDGGPSNPGYFTGPPEAYACYTPENTTLTFYYDDQRNSREGTTYDLNTGYINPGWITDGTNANVTEVVFDPSFADVRPTSTYTWFYLMSNLQSITGISYLNTSQVTNMGYMFKGCESLTSLDLTHFNTEGVMSMNDMFYYCIGLTDLDLSSFNTANVTRMEYMFGEAYNLAHIVVGDEWSTTAVTNSAGMFNRCEKLVGSMGTTYDASHVDKAYAHIDGGPSNPGYLSGKTEAYAAYTADNTTLTFYYDGQRSLRTGSTYDLNRGSNNPGWLDDEVSYSVTHVVFDPSFVDARPDVTFCWFSGMNSLVSITGMREYLNTSEVRDMYAMFFSCRLLTDIDVSNFNTAKVTDMRFMFSMCNGLTSLDLSSFNTANVTEMSNMFYNCNHLTTIDVGSGWSTASTNYSADMFMGCTSLVGGMGTTYDPSHVDAEYAHIDGGTSNPGYFTGKAPEAYACYTADNTTLTFYYDFDRSIRTGRTYDLNRGTDNPGWLDDEVCYSVTHVVFDPSFVDARPSSTFCWFSGMSSLVSITGMKEYLNTSQVIDMYAMFFNCRLLTDIDVSNFNTDMVTSMSFMFGMCNGLTSLDLSSFNTANVTSIYSMFSGCTNLNTIYVGSGWSTAAVTSSSNMFENCASLVGGKGTTYNASHVDAEYAHIDGGPNNPGYLSGRTEAYACFTPDNTTLTFYYDNLRSSRSGTTYGLNLGNEGMEWHENPYFFTQVVFDPSFADVRLATTSKLFEGMVNVRSITGLEYLNTDSVTDMSNMFYGCRKLLSVDLSHFNTSNVTSMYFMFSNCSALTSLDLSSFNTDNVTTMECMFLDCMGLTSVDLSGFTNARVSATSNMFNGCSALTTIYADSGWSLPANNYSYAMFANCTSLVGGQGTTFDGNHTDAEYAHIDGGPSNPGYFTEKTASQIGDVNGDSLINVADVTALIAAILNSMPVDISVADLNNDGLVNVADVTALIQIILNN